MGDNSASVLDSSSIPVLEGRNVLTKGDKMPSVPKVAVKAIRDIANLVLGQKALDHNTYEFKNHAITAINKIVEKYYEDIKHYREYDQI